MSNYIDNRYNQTTTGNAYRSAKVNKEFYDKKAREAKTQEEREKYEKLAAAALESMRQNKDTAPVSPYSKGQFYLKEAAKDRQKVLDAASNPFERLLS